MKHKKETVQDIYDDLERKQLELNIAGYDNMGFSMLVVFFIMVLIFAAIIYFK